jgi:tetratricopeptide (TPR) repeat protein
VLLLAAGASGPPVRAADPVVDASGDLRQAVTLYTQAMDTQEREVRLEAFRRAQRMFARVVGSGVENPELYVNLGNAALQAERLGDAVLAYRRALELEPAHARARRNLVHARGLLPPWVPRAAQVGLLEDLRAWQGAIARGERALAAGLAFLSTCVLLALGLALRSTLLRGLAALPGLVWLVLAGSLVLDPARRAPAVVTAPDLMARAADSPLAPIVFAEPLPPGTEVDVLEDRDPWLQLRLANGREVWVMSQGVTRIDAPRDAS